MELSSMAGGIATAWLAHQAAKAVGLDVPKIAAAALDDVAGGVKTALGLPANSNIGRIINTTA